MEAIFDSLQPRTKRRGCLTFTDEPALHLGDLGVRHRFEYGDELIVLDRDDTRKFKVLIGDLRDPAWQTWMLLSIAENGRDFWLKSQELSSEGEGVSAPLPPARWSKNYQSFTPEEKQQFWRDEDLDAEVLWKMLTAHRDDGQAKVDFWGRIAAILDRAVARDGRASASTTPS